MSKDSPAIYFIGLWPIFFVAIWAVWNILRDSRQEKEALRAAKWPEAQGKVLGAKAVWGHFEVAYEYVVGNRFYKGTHILNLKPAVPDQYARGARAMISEIRQDQNDYPVGAPIIVRYNPRNPQESILLCRAEVTKAADEEKTPEFTTIS